MKIVLFGATGKVGRLLVAGALARGHSVTAFARTPSKLQAQDRLTIAQGDIYDADSVARALHGSDAALSALGSWGTPKKDIVSSGMANIIPAMKECGMKRIVSLTGSGAFMEGDHFTLLNSASRPLMKLGAGKILADGEKHLQLLAESGLDWTVVRSPAMTLFGDDSQFTLSVEKQPQPWQTIHRQSVATAMLDLVESSDYAGQAPFISRS